MNPISDAYQEVEQDVAILGKVREIQMGRTGKTYILSVQDISKMPDTISCSSVIVYSNAMDGLSEPVQIGNLLSVQGKLQSFSLPGNPGQFNEFEYYKQNQIDFRIFAKKITVVDATCSQYRQFLYDAKECFINSIKYCLSEQQAGIITAMLTGEKSLLGVEEKRLYERAGISHILAISGLHVSILGSAIFYFLRKYICRMQIAAVLTLFFLISYGFFTGFSIATERAVIMMCCMLVSYLTGYSYDPPSAMCLAAIISLCESPYILFQAGFLLSYGTVCGIYIVVPIISKCFPLDWMEKTLGRGVKNIVASFAGSLGITISTLPIVLYFFYEMPVYGVLVNLFVLPVLSCVVGMGFLAGCLGMISILAGKFFFGIVSALLYFIDIICRFATSLPSSVVTSGQPELWQVFFYYLVLAVICIFMSYERRKVWLLYAASLFLLFYRVKTPDFSYWMLDVGQGDGMYLQMEGRHFLVDGGSSSESGVGIYRILPFLKSKGVTKIEAAFMTHSDEDHINGIMEIVENRSIYGVEIGKVVFPYLYEPDEAYLDIVKRCEEAGVKVEYLQKGGEILFQKGRIECLHPSPDYPYQSVNDYSLVLQVSYQTYTILLTGDLEMQGEDEILTHLGPVNVLKAGHHGSKNSTSEQFLKKLNPQMILFSAGAGNRYGHPARETCERVKNQKIPSFCTIHNGAVNLIIQEGKFHVSYFKTACHPNKKQVE